jgi:hypothetical protein
MVATAGLEPEYGECERVDVWKADEHLRPDGRRLTTDEAVALALSA